MEKWDAAELVAELAALSHVANDSSKEVENAGTSKEYLTSASDSEDEEDIEGVHREVDEVTGEVVLRMDSPPIPQLSQWEIESSDGGETDEEARIMLDEMV